ncbi:MAG TPA: multidrug effflux MFS transporter [Steroidobacteraceae bacterium]|jgi:DHA1 family bicyclomycin/chloramphenicol resistance-like MFS transporter|nr:multidrug effflux MFS transporter [Steroidobacteraceae bacterium]
MHTEGSRSPPRAIGFREFLVLTAAIMACQAIAVDTMLPGLPAIARDLGVRDANSAQWVITTYIAGVGFGQLFWGMLSDRFGRRRILLAGLALYVMAAAAVGMAGDFRALLAWRFAHGIAAASMVISRSIIRDLYGGRQMARVMSLTFIVFIMVPIIAPSIGQLVLLVAPWRALFHVFCAFAAAVLLWVYLRLPETLHPEYRMTLTADRVVRAAAKVVCDRASLWYTLCVALMFGSIIGYVDMMPQIFGAVFHRPALMPTAFAMCAASMGVASFLNSMVVERFGMRIISQAGLLIFIVVTALHVLVAAVGAETLWTFVILQGATMGCLGLIMANFGAMALDRLGSVAGIAASLQGCVGTFGGAVVAALIGQRFNGSTVPLALGALLCGLLSLAFVLLAEGGRLFRPHQLLPGELSPAASGIH